MYSLRLDQDKLRFPVTETKTIRVPARSNFFPNFQIYTYNEASALPVARHLNWMTETEVTTLKNWSHRPDFLEMVFLCKMYSAFLFGLTGFVAGIVNGIQVQTLSLAVAT